MINSQQAVLGCADFDDADGTVDHGIVALGFNNQAYPWQDGELDGQMGTCREALGD